MRLIPGAVAVLVGQSINDLGCAACRRLVHDRTDDGSSHRYRGCDSNSRGDRIRVIAAAAAVVTAATMVAATGVYVDVAIDVDVGVVIDVGIAIDVLVVVDVGVAIGGFGWRWRCDWRPGWRAALRLAPWLALRVGVELTLVRALLRVPPPAAAPPPPPPPPRPPRWAKRVIPDTRTAMANRAKI